MSSLPRIGYVLTVYPRLSETFVMNEVAGLERLGLEITIFSQKPRAAGGPPVPLATRAPVVVLSGCGGWERLRAFAAALRDHLHLLATRPRRYLSLLRWAWERGNLAALKKFWRAGRVARECERRHIDHLHAHFLSGNTRVARIAAALAGRTYSLTAHAKDIYATGLSESKLERRIGGAAFAVTVSEHNRAHLARLAGPERLVVIRNGVDVARIGFRPERRGARIVLAVGRLVPKKGFAVLVEAMARLGPADRAWIVGDGPEAESLSALVAARGLGGRVELLGARPHGEVLELMGLASVLAVPSVIAADGDRDGLPTVLPEAMAAGLPVVAAATTGIPELVIDGVTGLLVEPGDAGGLARALASLLGDPGRAVALARAARAKVEAEYDLGRNVALLGERFAALRRGPAPDEEAAVPDPEAAAVAAQAAALREVARC